MRVPLKLLGFGFWLLSLNFARCQECHREDIKYENTEPVAKASYTDGETIKVNCMTGYTGLYKLKCEKGEWKQSFERPCAKRKCGHPGDTPHGDFKLTDGTEFVFGATVVYTCKKGYEMTSRINQRTCRAQGWDKALPVCEVVKCPAIRTDGDVTASGNTEEGSYGNVIHFECVSSDKKIDGSSDIHCNEMGKWSDVVPKCKDITCTVPVISNGYVVEPRPKYQKDAILKYECYKGFKAREGIPRCAKFGWTLNPECDEITCELKSTAFGVKKINPKGKTFFRVEERVEITCSEKYWFIFTKETSRSFTCKDTGEWDHRPVCEEITCEDPYEEHVSRPYFWRKMKLGEKQSYSCESGYRKMAAEATCTQDGWKPKPLCTEITCELKSTTFDMQKVNPKGKTIFRAGERVEITCSEKYWFIFTKETRKLFTCKDTGEWDHRPVCEEITCEAPYEEHVSRPYLWRKMKLGEKQSYSCESGYRKMAAEATCTQDGWKPKPLCTEITCELKSTTFDVQKVNPKGKTIFRAGERVEITCSEKYWFIFTKETSRSFTCKDTGEWDHRPVCEEITCEDSYEEHVFIPYFWRKMKLGEKQSYSCKSGYRKMAAEATCTQDGWKPKPLCTEITCELKSTTFNVQKVNPKGKTIFRAGERVEITCSEKYWFIFTKETSRSFTCKDTGEWDHRPVCEEITCEDPYEEHVSITHFWRKMKLGEKQSYSCESGYRKMAAEATCTQDGWKPKPFCTEGVRCEIPPNVENADITKSEEFYVDGSSVTYKCRSPFLMSGKSTVFCYNGTWEETPTCEGKICPQPPYVENGNFTARKKDGEVITEVSYTCKNFYVLDKQQEYYKCENGKWETPPKCLSLMQNKTENKLE